MATIAARVMRVMPDPVRERWEHGEVWGGVDELVVRLAGAHWYGMGGLLHQQWPLEKLAMPNMSFVTSDNGATGLLGILEPLWLNSEGFGIHVEGDEMEVGLNAPLNHDSRWMRPDYKQLPNWDRPPLASGLETDGMLTIRGRNMTIRFFEMANVREAVLSYWKYLPECAVPPQRLLENPLWTTWAQFKNDISHAQIIEVAETARRWGFTPAVFGIDAKWQREFGESTFDPRKFPDPRGTVRRLHELGCEVTLWTVPFVMPATEHYEEAVAQRLVLMNDDGTPFLGRWWEGVSVFLDFTNPEAVQWYGEKLHRLVAEHGVDGFKFDAGEGEFYNRLGGTPSAPTASNRLAAMYLTPLAVRYPWSDARAGWRCQHLPMLFRQWDKKTCWGVDNGLQSCITQALTLNLLGYRFSFPDMIAGNEWHGDRADAEMIVRWTQAVAPMPFIQFSVPPWREGEGCVQICVKYAELHRELAPRYARLMREKLPLLRPMWWLAPHDEEALCCDDQYLIGDEVLVAPVVHAGARARDVYLPPGRWRNYWNPSEVHEGPATLGGYRAELEELPLFERF